VLIRLKVLKKETKMKQKSIIPGFDLSSGGGGCFFDFDLT
jgi:hypothetical protein